MVSPKFTLTMSSSIASKGTQAQLGTPGPYRGAGVGSDHALLVSKIKLSFRSGRAQTPPRPRFQTAPLHTEKGRAAYQIALAPALSAALPTSDNHLRWQQLVHALTQAAKSILAPTQRPCKPWISATTLQLAEQKRRVWQACQQAHASPASKTAYKRVSHAARSSALTDRCRHDRKAMQELQSSLARGDMHKAFQYLRQRRQPRSKAERITKLRDKHGKLLQTAEERIHRWWEYCSERFRVTTTVAPHVIQSLSTPPPQSHSSQASLPYLLTHLQTRLPTTTPPTHPPLHLHNPLHPLLAHHQTPPNHSPLPPIPPIHPFLHPLNPPGLVTHPPPDPPSHLPPPLTLPTHLSLHLFSPSVQALDPKTQLAYPLFQSPMWLMWRGPLSSSKATKLLDLTTSSLRCSSTAELQLLKHSMASYWTHGGQSMHRLKSKRDIVILIPKTAGADDCKTYRTAKLTVYAMVLRERLSKWLEQQLLEPQYGFRPGRRLY